MDSMGNRMQTRATKRKAERDAEENKKEKTRRVPLGNITNTTAQVVIEAPVEALPQAEDQQRTIQQRTQQTQTESADVALPQQAPKKASLGSSLFGLFNKCMTWATAALQNRKMAAQGENEQLFEVVAAEQPSAVMESEQPSAVMESEQPSAVMESEQPSAVMESEQPTAGVGAEQPSAPVVDQAALVPVQPPDLKDFDQKNYNDPFEFYYFAMDIFNQMKTNEAMFRIDDYMSRQTDICAFMRTQLVDWMVEMHDIFELEPKTLYMAVKILDIYLSRVVTHTEWLQLLGITALSIASKYAQSIQPIGEDMLEFCDEPHCRDELFAMERKVLRIIEFNLGMPLACCFLERNASCARIDTGTLMLARYILELSLMEYATVGLSESKLAAAALFMALRMQAGHSQLEQQPWTSTLVFYTGYKLAEFAHIVPILNAPLHRPQNHNIEVIRKKYSKQEFNKVVDVPLLSSHQLFEHNLDLSVHPIQMA